MAHDGMHEQPPIPRENCAILRRHDLKQATILGSGFVKRVQSQEAKIARKLSQMTVGDKAIETRRLQPRSGRKKISRGGESINVEPQRNLNLPAKIDT